MQPSCSNRVEFDVQKHWVWSEKAWGLTSNGIEAATHPARAHFSSHHMECGRGNPCGWASRQIEPKRGHKTTERKPIHIRADLLISFDRLWDYFYGQFVCEWKSIASYTTERTRKLNQKRSKPNTIKLVWIVGAQPVLYKKSTRDDKT